MIGYRGGRPTAPSPAALPSGRDSGTPAAARVPAARPAAPGPVTPPCTGRGSTTRTAGSPSRSSTSASPSARRSSSSGRRHARSGSSPTPAILSVHGADVLPDARPYLVTELCEGSLADRIAARGRLDPHEVTAVGLVVGRALLHAHDARRAARRPHAGGRAVARRRRSGAGRLRAGRAARLPRRRRAHAAHAAPETVRADGAVDERTDVYGLGSILFTALAGAAPFPTRRGEQEQDRLARILLDRAAGGARAGVARGPGAGDAREGTCGAADAPPGGGRARRRRRRRRRAGRCQEKPLTPARRCPPRGRTPDGTRHRGRSPRPASRCSSPSSPACSWSGRPSADPGTIPAARTRRLVRQEASASAGSAPLGRPRQTRVSRTRVRPR